MKESTRKSKETVAFEKAIGALIKLNAGIDASGEAASEVAQSIYSMFKAASEAGARCILEEQEKKFYVQNKNAFVCQDCFYSLSTTSILRLTSTEKLTDFFSVLNELISSSKTKVTVPGFPLKSIFDIYNLVNYKNTFLRNM